MNTSTLSENKRINYPDLALGTAFVLGILGLIFYGIVALASGSVTTHKWEWTAIWGIRIIVISVFAFFIERGISTRKAD